MESIEGRRLHGMSAQARERGEAVEALKLGDEATATYQRDGDRLGYAESLADRAIALGHISEKSEDPFFATAYLIDARNTSRSAVEVAERSGDITSLAIPYLRFGRAQENLGELNEAVESYRKAVQNMTQNPPAAHNRAAVIADFKNHLATAEYKAGDKSALERAEEGLKDFDQVEVLTDEQLKAQNGHLNFNQEPSYNYNVWLSGAHMRIAEMLKTDDPAEAKKHLEEAKKIIDSDPKLIIRKDQWQKLAKTF